MIFFCFVLSGWQIYRFFGKYHDFEFLSKQNDIIDSNKKIFVDPGIGDSYSWTDQSYRLNLKNNRIYQLIEPFLRDDESEKRGGNLEHEPESIMSDKNLFFRNEVCGKYIAGYSFAIYKPRKIGDFTKNGYSIVVPLLFNRKILLVNYFWSDSLDIAQEEIDRLDRFERSKTNLLPEDFVMNKSIGLCFTGIVLPTKKFYSPKILSVFSMNDLKNNVWTNLNERDLYKHFKNFVVENGLDEKIISQYMIDTNLEDFSIFLKNYKHHIFYAIMWLISGLYLIFIMKKLKI